MKTARFRVHVSDGWVTCIPKNEEAKGLIKGKLGALWPGPRIPEPYVPFEFKKKTKKSRWLNETVERETKSGDMLRYPK